MIGTPFSALWARAIESVQKDAKPPRPFADYVSACQPRYQWYRHCVTLADALQGVADGTIKRLMVFEPPRHGKSEEASRLFPGYYLERHPDHWVGLASYAASLAFTLSRNARDLYERAGNAIHPGASGVEQWETLHGGGMWAAGVGGPITGKGGHVLIVDDPLKNAKEANSDTIREKHKDWWRSTFYTRAEPDAAIVVIQTRWNEDDLAGYLLSQELDEDPERWHILNLEAIKEEKPQTFPPSCTVLPDWRQTGDALCPERYPIEKLRRMERRIGGYYFGALYQQRPTALAGDVFKREWWQYYTTTDHPISGVRSLPTTLDRVIQSWDMTFKDEEQNDYVSGQVWARRFNDLFLLDRVNERLSFTASCAAVETMAGKWPAARGKYIEDKANGPAIINSLRRHVSGIVPVKPDGGKIARAYAVQPYVESCQCFLPHPSIAPWVEDFIRQLAQFPRGAHDDDVDAATQALNILTRGLKDEPEEDDARPDGYVEITPDMYAAEAERQNRIDWRKKKRRERPTDPNFGEY